MSVTGMLSAIYLSTEYKTLLVW